MVLEHIVFVGVFHADAAACHDVLLLLKNDSTLSESSINDIRRKVHEAIALNKSIYNLDILVSSLLPWL